ncbi:MAG: DUF3426 domain-containing protein [Deltaproteobacteria bacterium]|nr:DUF3426 domain-containing protein [Deltaproteobacteria bacterium]
MIVECESCKSTFRLDETQVKAEGAKVRCSVCKAVFTVDPFEDLPGSLDQKTETPKREPEAVQTEAPATAVMDSASEEIGEDGRLNADLDMVYRDVFRESTKVRDQENGVASEAPQPVDDAHGVFKEAVEGEALSVSRPSVDFPHMSDLEEDPADGADEMSFEAAGSEEESFDGPLEEVDKVPVRKKKSVTSKIITVVLIIFLLVLAAAAALVFLRPQWIPPYLSFLKPPVKKQVSDAGVRLLMFKGVSGSFLDAEKAGNLFLIRGEVSNKYRKPRSYILIKGNIIDEKGQVIKSELAYAGNTFTDEELKTISYEEIKRAMKNKDGMARQNFNIPPGETIPFMIVFRNLPDNLSEFTVEAVSSSPGPESIGKNFFRSVRRAISEKSAKFL